MSLQSNARMADSMTVGKFYTVPAVRVRTWHGFSGWLPVIGPKHEDAEFINFPWQHYHLDWRFAPDSVFKKLSYWRGPTFVYGAAIQCPDTRGTRVIDEGPVQKRMKCKREPPAYPFDSAPWVKALAAKYACAKLTKGLCPHRGIPVTAMIRDGDILTCPGHGLRWNALTGEQA